MVRLQNIRWPSALSALAGKRFVLRFVLAEHPAAGFAVALSAPIWAAALEYGRKYVPTVPAFEPWLVLGLIDGRCLIEPGQVE